jgi:hypothetical protein
MRELATLGVSFAYPTRTLFVEGPVQVAGAGRGNGAQEPESGDERRPRASPSPVNPS